MSYANRIPDAVRKKGYAHFDSRVTYKQMERLVENPEFVRTHAFYPLISTSILTTKYRKIPDSYPGKDVVDKDRPIAYAAHIDHRIYQYYALLWSDRYEAALESAGASGAVIAYRAGKHLSNITGAARAIGAIRHLGDVLVMTGDFRSFFPSLDHDYLSKAVKGLFDENRLPEDHYQVFKSVIRSSSWPLDEILKIRGLDYSSAKKRQKSIRRLNRSRSHALSKSEFKENKNRCIEKPWKGTSRGIPQGLAVSGVLSNIYMLETDSQIIECLKECGGYYSRYCDDFIVVVPWEKRACITEVRAILGNAPSVTLHSEKTRFYYVTGGVVYSLESGVCSGIGDKSRVSYLGFDFDGSAVSLRAGTIGRFFNRYYRSVRGIQKRRKGMTNKQRYSMYRRFSEKGNNPAASFEDQNFLSYVARAQRAFPNDPISKPFQSMYKRLRRDLQ